MAGRQPDPPPASLRLRRMPTRAMHRPGIARSNAATMSQRSVFEIASASGTHVGGVRKHNEDACLDRPDLGLWVVADGMGGHQAGDVASRLIIESLGAVTAPQDAGSFIAEV